jgi:type III restriction enzyme
MATKRAATKGSTSGASLDFAFFRFLWQFYQDNRGHPAELQGADPQVP